MSERPNLITAKEALQIGKFSRRKLYNLIRDGKLRAYKDGSRTLVDAESLADYQKNLPVIATRTPG